MPRDHSSLRSHFDVVINNSSDSLLELLDLPDNVTVDSRFLKDVCNFSVDELAQSISGARSELESLSTGVLSEMFVSDRNVISGSIDSINSIISKNVSRLESLVNSLDVSHKYVHDDFRAEKESIMYLLSQYSILIDLLDIPQLMETCVRNGYYSEALNLHAFVLVRAQKFPHTIYSTLLLDQVTKIRSKIIESVTHSLNEKKLTLQESQTLLIVYRLLFPKTEDMGKIFIEGRKKYFNSFKKSASLSEIIQQCTILFPSLDLTEFVLDEIYMYISQIDESSLTEEKFSTFIHMGTSMEKIGYMMNPIIVWKYQETYFRVIDAKLMELEKNFKTELANFDWIPFTSLSDQPITRHRPVTILYNGIISILNDIGRFPLLGIESSILNKFNQLISSIMTEILKVDETNEKKIMADTFTTEFVPSVLNMFKKVFPNVVI